MMAVDTITSEHSLNHHMINKWPDIVSIMITNLKSVFRRLHGLIEGDLAVHWSTIDQRIAAPRTLGIVVKYRIINLRTSKERWSLSRQSFIIRRIKHHLRSREAFALPSLASLFALGSSKGGSPRRMIEVGSRITEPPRDLELICKSLELKWLPVSKHFAWFLEQRWPTFPLHCRPSFAHRMHPGTSRPSPANSDWGFAG